jgi:membrane protein implicated in regulation of membrane protease activity
MAPPVIRWVVLVVCAAGVAAMIVSSIVDANGAALTFGLITAVAVACLMVATAVAGGAGTPEEVDDARAARVEQMIGRLVADGADEGAVRELVREASRLRAQRTA